MHTLKHHLNQLFTKARPAAAKAHVIDGITVTKINGLWTATVAGVVHQNSHLGDIRAIIRRRTI